MSSSSLTGGSPLLGSLGEGAFLEQPSMYAPLEVAFFFDAPGPHAGASRPSTPGPPAQPPAAAAAAGPSAPSAVPPHSSAHAPPESSSGVARTPGPSSRSASRRPSADGLHQTCSSALDVSALFRLLSCPAEAASSPSPFSAQSTRPCTAIDPLLWFTLESPEACDLSTRPCSRREAAAPADASSPTPFAAPSHPTLCRPVPLRPSVSCSASDPAPSSDDSPRRSSGEGCGGEPSPRKRARLEGAFADQSAAPPPLAFDSESDPAPRSLFAPIRTPRAGQVTARPAAPAGCRCLRATAGGPPAASPACGCEACCQGLATPLSEPSRTPLQGFKPLAT